MNTDSSRSRFTQRRVDYIVYGNPSAVRKLIRKNGYSAPRDIHKLLKKTKLVIRKKGRAFVKDLIKQHPDRQAILKVEKAKEDSFCGACNSYSYNAEDNFCGVCGHSSYTGEEDKEEFIDQLKEMTVNELEEYYENSTKKANDNPQDTKLSEEARLIWNELRLRKQDIKEESKPSQSAMYIKPSQAYLMLMIALGGLVIGHSLKQSS